MKYRVLKAVSIVMILTAMAGFLFTPSNSRAQSSRMERQHHQSDMWNPNWMQRDMWRRGQMGSGMQQRMARHWTFMHEGIPAAYQGARNPFASDTKIINEGRTLYQQNCASCHGTTGLGDGELANSLNPSPALLAYMIQMPMSVDPYMLWSISEGGEAFGTAMPAFKDALTRDEIWKIITFMRSGFPVEQQK